MNSKQLHTFNPTSEDLLLQMMEKLCRIERVQHEILKENTELKKHVNDLHRLYFEKNKRIPAVDKKTEDVERFEAKIIAYELKKSMKQRNSTKGLSRTGLD